MAVAVSPPLVPGVRGRAAESSPIVVGYPDGSADSLDCQPGDASVACIPIASRVVPSFAANGALESLHVVSPDSGTYAVQIAVDGAPAAAGSFDYAPTYTQLMPPGERTPAVYCASSETFTIGN